MASNAPITAAVVGGGVMGAFHVRALLDRPDVEAVVLVEPSEERRALLERRHGRLRIAIAVRFAAAEDGPRRVRLTLVREDPARRRTGPRRRGAPGRTTEGRDAR